MPPAFYFAYGSNMDSATLRDRRGIAWTRASPAVVRGWRLEVDKPSLLGTGEGMATIVADEGAEVWGVLYEISASDLEHLELSEGVRIGHYERREVLVHAASAWDGSDGPLVRAATLVSDDRDEAIRPTTRYRALLVSGAVEHGLPDAWVERLRAIDAVEESAEAAAWRPLFDRGMGKSR